MTFLTEFQVQNLGHPYLVAPVCSGALMISPGPQRAAAAFTSSNPTPDPGPPWASWCGRRVAVGGHRRAWAGMQGSAPEAPAFTKGGWWSCRGSGPPRPLRLEDFPWGQIPGILSGKQVVSTAVSSYKMKVFNPCFRTVKDLWPSPECW